MTTETIARPEPKRAEWQALIHLSVGRRGDTEKGADLVVPQETIWLTEDESARFLDPRRYPVTPIRPASQKNDPLPRITASTLYRGSIRPMAPAPIPGAPVALDVTDESRIVENTSIAAPDPEVTDPDADRIGAPIRQQPRRTR